MFRTLRADNKVIGMYLSDSSGVYFNGDEKSKTAFITSEFSNYIPILDLLQINHRQEVKFANGINKNEEVVTYNKGISGRSYTDSVIRQNNIDVSVNDLFVGPMTLFLNFTQYNLTVINNKEFRKTFVPIENNHLDDFKGKVVIMNLHTLNTPKNIQNVTGCSNYLEVLLDRFKNRNAPNISEMKEVIKYAYDKWGESKFFAAMQQSNSIKIATMIELHETEFNKEVTDGLFLVNQDLILTLDTIVEAKEHPATTNPAMANRGLQEDIRKNSFTCYIVDKDDQIADRYINIAGVVKKITKIKDHNLINGLHIITTDHEGNSHDEVVADLENLDNNRYVYRSAEEANTGADMRVQYKDTIDTKRSELEVTKLDKTAEGLEMKNFFEMLNRQHATEMDRVRGEIKIVTDLVKAVTERDNMVDKRKLERDKTDGEIRTTAVKRDYDYMRFDMDNRSHRQKVDYESTRYERDSFVEGLKTVGAVAGVMATGFLVYSKFAGAKA